MVERKANCGGKSEYRVAIPRCLSVPTDRRAIGIGGCVSLVVAGFCYYMLFKRHSAALRSITFTTGSKPNRTGQGSRTNWSLTPVGETVLGFGSTSRARGGS